MKYLSLFSGIGGFEIGIQKAYEQSIRNTSEPKEQSEECIIPNERSSSDTSTINGNRWGSSPTCIGYSEIDKYAIQIYQKHFNHKNYGDITKINIQELPDFDLLVGGFPCQAFSIAGKRRGFDDTRGTLFFDVARILKEKQPRNFILENVKGLLSHDSGRTFKTIINTLAELGYCVEWQVLNAKNFGVPQNRERVFIVGHFRGMPKRKVFPIRENNSEDIVLPTITTRITADSNGTYVSKRPPYKILRGRPKVPYESGKRELEYKTYDKIVPTLSTNPASGDQKNMVMNETRIRRLIPLECERLMGYPDGWTEGVSDTQRYKTLGNGIVSNVVAEVVRRIYGNR